MEKCQTNFPCRQGYTETASGLESFSGAVGVWGKIIRFAELGGLG